MHSRGVYEAFSVSYAHVPDLSRYIQTMMQLQLWLRRWNHSLNRDTTQIQHKYEYTRLTTIPATSADNTVRYASSVYGVAKAQANTTIETVENLPACGYVTSPRRGRFCKKKLVNISSSVVSNGMPNRRNWQSDSTT